MKPSYNLHNDLEARKQRWRAIMAPGAKPGYMMKVNFPDKTLPPPPPHWPDKAAERVEYKWKAYQRALQKAAVIRDDWIPYLDMVTGTDIFAEAFGCKVHRPADNMPFALPLVHSAAEAERVKVPELSGSSLAYLFDMADELRRRAGPDAVMRVVDVQAPMDIAALIWEKQSLFVAMIETPDAVKELAAKATQLLTAFLDEWFRRYGKEQAAHCPDYFMPGGVTLSEDEVGAVSKEMFREFFLPELAALSERYGGLGMHCCAEARHLWEDFKLIPGLRLLNFNIIRPPTPKGIAYIQDGLKFFAKTCVQQHGGWAPGEPFDKWPAGFPVDSRVVIDVNCQDEAEAIRRAVEVRETFLQP